MEGRKAQGARCRRPWAFQSFSILSSIETRGLNHLGLSPGSSALSTVSPSCSSCVDTRAWSAVGASRAASAGSRSRSAVVAIGASATARLPVQRTHVAPPSAGQEGNSRRQSRVATATLVDRENTTGASGRARWPRRGTRRPSASEPPFAVVTHELTSLPRERSARAAPKARSVAAQLSRLHAPASHRRRPATALRPLPC